MLITLASVFGFSMLRATLTGVRLSRVTLTLITLDSVFAFSILNTTLIGVRLSRTTLTQVGRFDSSDSRDVDSPRLARLRVRFGGCFAIDRLLNSFERKGALPCQTPPERNGDCASAITEELPILTRQRRDRKPLPVRFCGADSDTFFGRYLVGAGSRRSQLYLSYRFYWRSLGETKGQPEIR